MAEATSVSGSAARPVTVLPPSSNRTETSAWAAVDAGGPTPRDAFAWDQLEEAPWIVLVGGDPLDSSEYASDVWFLALDSLTWTEAKQLDGESF